MMLGEIVRTIEDAFFPVDVKLALADSVADPIETHIDCLGALLFDGVVGNAGSSAIVGNDGRGRLRMAELFEAES